MKIIRENLWNRIFHKDRIHEQQDEARRQQHIIDVADSIITALQDCNRLTEMYHLHKNIWDAGLRNRNIGPNQYGMFRTKDISTMRPEEVMLGNIYGLWTFPIPAWEANEKAQEPFGANDYGIIPETTVYEVIVTQYRNILMSNVRVIKREAENFITAYYRER